MDLNNLTSDPEGLVALLLQSVGQSPTTMPTNNSGRTPQSMELASLLQEDNGLWSDAVMSRAMAAAAPRPLNTDVSKAKPISIGTMPADFGNRVGASAQDTIDYAMMNDPAFRKAVGYTPTPGTDPKGVAFERVNANTKNTGVTAFRKPDGSILLSNVPGDSGTFMGIPPSGSVPGSITSSLMNLRRTSNTAEASVILENINSTAAAETAKATKAAIEYAENAVGIPALQQKIFRSEQMDLNSPNFVPGMGDSAMTKQLKSEMQQARSMANGKAVEFLATSPTLGILRSQQNAAQQEMVRIDRKEEKDRTVQLNRETSAINRDEALANKQAVRDEAYESIDRSMSDEKKQAHRLLNSALANNKDPLAYAKEEVTLAKEKNPNKRLAIEAFGQKDDNKLISLAIAGNVEAKTLLHTKGKDPASVDTFLSNVAYLSNPNNIAAYLDRTHGKAPSTAKAAEAKELMAEDPKGGNDAAKETYRLGRIAKAIATEKRETTKRFFDSTSSWVIVDPEWQKAVQDTQQSRGTTNFDAVLNTYVGNSTDKEAVAKLRSIRDQVKVYMDSLPDDLAGRPDITVLQRKIGDKAKDSGIGKYAVNMVENSLNASPLSPIVGILNYGLNSMIGGMNNMFGNTKDSSILDSAGNLK